MQVLRMGRFMERKKRKEEKRKERKGNENNRNKRQEKEISRYLHDGALYTPNNYNTRGVF